jgi:hypothetical protein
VMTIDPIAAMTHLRTLGLLSDGMKRT